MQFLLKAFKGYDYVFTKRLYERNSSYQKKQAGIASAKGVYFTVVHGFSLKYQRKIELNYQWATVLMENNRTT